MNIWMGGMRGRERKDFHHTLKLTQVEIQNSIGFIETICKLGLVLRLEDFVNIWMLLVYKINWGCVHFNTCT